MTRNTPRKGHDRISSTRGRRKFGPSPISLKQTAPADWLHDRPAYPGDPFMDWENTPEPPKEYRWIPGLRRPHSSS